MTPLSSDPEARRRQLANLTRRPPAPPPGNGRAVRHGGYSEALVADVGDEVRELMEALGDAAPVRDPGGGLPPADVVAVERAARLLRRYRHLEAWLDVHGSIDDRTGEVKPAARLAQEVGRALDRALDVLAMNPTSRGRLGLDLARTEDVARGIAALGDGEGGGGG